MAKQSEKKNPLIESLKERMGRDPLSRAFLQLAEAYRKEGNYEEAVRVCLEGLERHPTYHTARISLGRTYLEAGNLEAAGRALSDVLELAPENHLAGKLLAEVQRKMGNPSGAAETYRTILRHYPGDREVET
ncbi:MAG: tetratricopeptide repeat protein, partial [Candidatus Polarisedimenticolia bacterium]